MPMRTMKRTLVAVALLAAPAANLAMPDVSEIIRQSVAANHRNLGAAADFDHCERVITRDGTKTYMVTMMLGTPYQRLTEINGQPLSNDERDREQQKQDAARIERERETADARATRLAKHEKESRRNRQLLDQLPQAFDFTFEGEQMVGRFDAFVLRATPRRDYQPPTLEAQVLTGMEGRFWIERTSFQWIKAEAAVVRPVSIASFLARVDPGTQFTLEQSPVASQVWMPAHFSMRTRGRVLFLLKQRTQIDATYYDYRPVNRPVQRQ
jgi:hypothetical protein